ncbi:MAG: hypothetical protein ACQEVT_06390 [Pseudomonadota bacterium]|uniref:hypothetical protein n=1 Tax=Roseovarius TaxID=74030 RepID=UPI0022A67AA6|nr:hypothetical protein [Roseovarius sp. EGI FJ00037]MCZ0810825.1 hypothetical protein [Roseovarius sp. EGI FJ00037]
MTIDMTKPSLKMISVMNACNRAAAGPQKTMALKHCQAAAKARAANKEAESNRHLDAAAHAIAQSPVSDLITGTTCQAKERSLAI